MPYSSGTFSLYTPGNPVVTGTTIASTWANNTLTDIATGLSTAVLKDGTQTITANLPMSTHKLTGLSAGSAAGDTVRYEQVFTATALTDQATITWDTSLAPVATVTLTASRTMAAPTNIKTGGTYTLIVTQNATGGWTLTWNGVFKAFGGGTMPQPETTLSTSSAFTFVSPDGTNLICTSCVPFVDTNYFVRGSADATKKVRFEVDGLTTATTRVITMPDTDVNLTGIGANQTANTVYAGPSSGAAAAPSFRSLVGAESAMVLLGSKTATSTATISFAQTAGTGDVLFDWTAYDLIILEFVQLIPVNNATLLQFQISQDSGSTYKNGATAYASTAESWTSGGAVFPAASTSAGNLTSADGTTGPQSNSTNYGLSGFLRIMKPSNAIKKFITADLSYLDSGAAYRNTKTIVDYNADSNAINGIKFFYNSGNISSGTIYAYGLRKT